MSKKTLIVTAVVMASVLGLAGVGAVSATSQTSPEDTMVSRIAKKFNLNKDDVQKEFDSARQQMHAEHQKERKAELESNLNAKVKSGVITEAQKTTLLQKMQNHHDQMEKNRKSNAKPDRETRKSEMDKFKKELDAWAKSEKIDLSKVLPQPGDGDGRGHGKGGMHF